MNICQKLALTAAGAALSFAAMEAKPAQAATFNLSGTYGGIDNTREVSFFGSFDYDAGSLEITGGTINLAVIDFPSTAVTIVPTQVSSASQNPNFIGFDTRGLIPPPNFDFEVPEIPSSFLADGGGSCVGVCGFYRGTPLITSYNINLAVVPEPNALGNTLGGVVLVGSWLLKKKG